MLTWRPATTMLFELLRLGRLPKLRVGSPSAIEGAPFRAKKRELASRVGTLGPLIHTSYRFQHRQVFAC